MAAEALQRAARVRFMLFDVDGTLTDGTLYLGESGESMKAFSVRDGHGLKLLRESGVEVGLLSGRRSGIVSARAEELGIHTVLQGVDDKQAALRALAAERSLQTDSFGYMGDDWPDLAVMSLCGFSATVPEAPAPVRSRAHYVSVAFGGRGAAREVCELILSAQGLLEHALRRHLP